MAHHWAPTVITCLRSALLTRANLWWSAYRHHAHLVPARRSSAERCLRWTAGSTISEVGGLLTDGPLKIPGALFTPPSTPDNIGADPAGCRHPRTQRSADLKDLGRP